MASGLVSESPAGTAHGQLYVVCSMSCLQCSQQHTVWSSNLASNQAGVNTGAAALGILLHFACPACWGTLPCWTEQLCAVPHQQYLALILSLAYHAVGMGRLGMLLPISACLIEADFGRAMLRYISAVM